MIPELQRRRWVAALPLGLSLFGCGGAPRAPEPTPTPDRPPIERLLWADSARALLPRHEAGHVDWVAALRLGVIRPRSELPETTPPGMAFQPQFEVLLRGPDARADAWFPHSSHVEWLTCEQCHSTDTATPIEPGYAAVQMADIIRGRYCGACHGVVAFAPTGQVETCLRCHRRLIPEDGPGAVRPGRRPAPHEAPGGARLYREWCAMCHGETGAGDGPVGRRLDPRPRDFTAGLYQLRTTASGELPTDADLRRVIDEGIPGTAMPGWKNRLTAWARDSLVAYVKSFSPFFDGPAPEPLEIPEPPPPGPGDLAAGRVVFDSMHCARCHGAEGHGDGPSAAELKDDFRAPIRPADLTARWRFNGGSDLADIYTRLRTGMDGTPMPSYSDALDAGIVSDRQLWQLARYVMSLGDAIGPLGDVPVTMNRVARDPLMADIHVGGVAAGMDTDDLPVARFPHWVHRIRFRCKACHPALFLPQARTNAMTMIEIGRGEACGRCHNGRAAFRAGFGQCPRCHAERQ